MKSKYPVSRELIEAVKGVKVLSFENLCPPDSVCFKYEEVVNESGPTPLVADGGIKTYYLYKLMVECKEWAITQGYYLETRYIKDYEKWRCIIHYEEGGSEETVPTFIPLDNSELEIVFEATEWIIKEIAGENEN